MRTDSLRHDGAGICSSASLFWLTLARRRRGKRATFASTRGITVRITLLVRYSCSERVHARVAGCKCHCCHRCRRQICSTRALRSSPCRLGASNTQSSPLRADHTQPLPACTSGFCRPLPGQRQVCHQPAQCQTACRGQCRLITHASRSWLRTTPSLGVDWSDTNRIPPAAPCVGGEADPLCLRNVRCRQTTLDLCPESAAASHGTAAPSIRSSSGRSPGDLETGAQFRRFTALLGSFSAPACRGNTPCMNSRVGAADLSKSSFNHPRHSEGTSQSDSDVKNFALEAMRSCHNKQL